MSRKKQYTITYRKRRDKDAKLLYLTIEGLNIDDVKRKFWDKYQKYDMYANPIFTLTKIGLDNNKKGGQNMIKSTKVRRDYKNEITDYLDKHLIKCYGCSDFYSNYIYSEPVNDYWAIRVPGATRGHIKVEDGVVKEIKLYEDTFCYDESVFDELNKFVGRKIDLEYIKK